MAPLRSVAYTINSPRGSLVDVPRRARAPPAFWRPVFGDIPCGPPASPFRINYNVVARARACVSVLFFVCSVLCVLTCPSPPYYFFFFPSSLGNQRTSAENRHAFVFR